jgi:F-type H+-transporting ATPase subunit b
MKSIKRYQFGMAVITASSMMTDAAKAAGSSEPGLPQLDISTWPSQLFWLVVLFGVGYLVMAKIVTPRIGMVLEERRQTLDLDLAKARTASEDAAKIREKYESDLEKARNEASEFARNAAAEAAKMAEEADAKTAKKLADKAAKAEAKLVDAKNAALTNLTEVAAAAAVEAVATVAGIKTTASAAGKTAAAIDARTRKQEAN